MRTLILGLVFLLGGMAVQAETVREKIKNDAAFPIYSVIFGITVNTNSEILTFEISKVIAPRTGNANPVQIDIPDGYIKKARSLANAHHYPSEMKDGKPVEFYTYFHYSPAYPQVVISDLDKDIDHQP